MLSLLISFNKSYSDIPLSTGPATIKHCDQVELFGSRLKSVNHDIRWTFSMENRNACSDNVPNAFGNAFRHWNAFWDAFGTRSERERSVRLFLSSTVLSK